MAGYFSDYLADGAGNKQPGVQVSVRVRGVSSLATIYAESSGSLVETANPLTTNSDGRIEFWVTSPGLYELTIGTQTRVVTVFDTAQLSGSANNVFTKAQSVAQVALTAASGTVAVNASLSNNFRLVLNDNYTLANPTNLMDGQTLTFHVIQGAVGGKTLTLGSKYKIAGGAPTFSTDANARDILCVSYDPTSDVLDGTHAAGCA